MSKATTKQTAAPANAPPAHPYARFRDLLERDSVRDALAKVLPKHVTPDRMFKIVQSAMSRTPKLYDCTPDSVLRAVMQAAELGLEIGGVLGEAYLVPTWNKKIGKLEADFRAGYRGFVKLALESGFVLDIDADVVRRDDVFKLVRGSSPSVMHEPNVENDESPLIGVYAVARYQNGGFRCVYLTRSRVEKVRARSQASSGPWDTDWEEMAKKTAVRNLIKMIPLSPRLATLAEREDERDFIEVAPEAPTAIGTTAAAPALPPAKAAGRKLAEELRARTVDAELVPVTVPHDPETGEVKPDAEEREPEPPPAGDDRGDDPDAY